MAGKPDAGGIGQDRATQDPEDALKREEGKYVDAVEKVPMDQRTQESALPRGPDKRPFGSLG